MKENLLLMCLVAFIVGYLVHHMMRGNSFQIENNCSSLDFENCNNNGCVWVPHSAKKWGCISGCDLFNPEYPQAMGLYGCDKYNKLGGYCFDKNTWKNKPGDGPYNGFTSLHCPLNTDGSPLFEDEDACNKDSNFQWCNFQFK